MTIDSTTKVYLNGVEQVKIIKNGSVVIWEKQQGNTDYFYIENTYPGQNTVTFTTSLAGSVPSDTYATSVQYSKNKSTWNTINFDTSNPQTITLEQGEKLYLRNSSGRWSNFISSSRYYLIRTTSNYSSIIGGNLKTLLDYTNSSVSLKEGCFFNCFMNNKGLTDASRLIMPTQTKTNAFQQFFRGCTSLTVAPSLPATTLASGCYSGMFQGCTALTTAPVLPATTLAANCYQVMFKGCTSLNSVTTYANNISYSNCLDRWLENVAATGTFNNLGSATYTPNSVNGIPPGWTEVKPQPAVDYFYIENTYNGSNTITITTNKYDYSEEDPEADPLDMTKCGTNLEWSKDKSTWTTLTLTAGGSKTISMNTGEKVYFRNDTGKFNYMDDWGSFWYSSFTNNHSASTGGDIHTLIDYTGTNISTRERYCLYNLFIGNTGLTDASNLTIPSTTPVDYEYGSLFLGSGLVTPPSTLPATTLATGCYQSMFQVCSALTSVPTLPATTLASSCYTQMFANCTSLTSVPSNLLPATDLTACDNCYESMFQSCSSLTTPPSLPATTLAFGCYGYMFESSGITTAPSLPATTLSESCYSYMFMNCSSLTTPPALSATNLASNCYMYMFPGSGITTAPVLPAWTLADYCYQGMLADTSITTAPELPANTLVEGCYTEMFANCENLDEVTCYATDITATDCTTDWLSNVAASGTLYAQRGVDYTADNSSGVPVGWSVVRMEPS